MDQKTHAKAMERIAAAANAINAAVNALREMPGIDQRSLAVARTQFETSLLWLSAAASGGGLLEG